MIWVAETLASSRRTWVCEVVLPGRVALVSVAPVVARAASSSGRRERSSRAQVAICLAALAVQRQGSSPDMRHRGRQPDIRARMSSPGRSTYRKTRQRDHDRPGRTTRRARWGSCRRAPRCVVASRPLSSTSAARATSARRCCARSAAIADIPRRRARSTPSPATRCRCSPASATSRTNMHVQSRRMLAQPQPVTPVSPAAANRLDTPPVIVAACRTRASAVPRRASTGADGSR